MRARALFSLLLAALAVPARGEGLLDQLDEALTFSGFEDRARLRISGLLDLEFYTVDEPPFALINSSSNQLFNPRLSLFLDAQFGSKFYAFAQARVDRGFDPASDGARVRLDEYALRFTPWEDGRFNLQVGKFSPVVGNWAARHLSWDNPFVTAPLPYEHLTRISDYGVPSSSKEFLYGRYAGRAYGYNPILWSAGYTTGVSIAGKLGKFEYAAELKNASLSSRPESWDATDGGFDHPTFSTRIGYRPSPAWNFGLSASSGAYLRPEAERYLPRGRDRGDYLQTVLGQDISYAAGHFQIWAEFYEARFDVPNVGHADTFAYYIEAKYKFTPAFYGALRWNQQLFADVPYGRDGERRWGQNIWRADAALGYRFSPHTQLKVQYSLENEDGPRGPSNALGVQFTLRF